MGVFFRTELDSPPVVSRLSIGVAGIVAAVFVAIGLLLTKADLSPVRTYSLPSEPEIYGMRVAYFVSSSSREDQPFDMPAKYWGQLLASLATHKIDQSKARYLGMAVIEISTKSGQLLTLSLYRIPGKPIGAFGIAPRPCTSGVKGTMYIGGNSEELSGILQHIQAERQNPSGCR